MTGARRRRRTVSLLVIASGAVPAVLFTSADTARAQAPDVAAWWSVANAGDPAPAPPSPPDVADGDLLVQGSNAAPAAPPVGAAPSTAQAVAGLSFALQPTDVVGALTLNVAGSPPAQVSVVACRATSSFTDASNGPWSQVPAYDGSKCVPGKLTGSQVVFDGVADLVDNARLSVVLLPGPIDRLVFKQPTDGTLAVQHGTGLGASAPPLGAGAGPGAAAAGSPGGVGGAAVTPAAPGGLPGAVSSTPSAGAPPVVAGAGPATGPAASPAMRPVAASSGLSTGARRGIALTIIALEVLGFALMARSPDPGAIAGEAAAGAAASRLRPPDRWTARASTSASAGGVGRFRRPRRGPAPQL